MIFKQNMIKQDMISILYHLFLTNPKRLWNNLDYSYLSKFNYSRKRSS